MSPIDCAALQFGTHNEINVRHAEPGKVLEPLRLWNHGLMDTYPAGPRVN